MNFKCLMCLLIFININNVQSIRYEGSADPDFARNTYVQLERSLWEKYVDKVSTLTQNERLYKIFNQHYMFTQQFVNKNYNHEDFSVLSRFYEWNILEPDVKSIHNLFKDSFMHRLQLDLDKNSAFDERANLDLAETIVEDPLWPINATLEKIQLNINNQGLYYKAISVCYIFTTIITN